ncbi:MAG: Acg family FMN-binding oxidoreductase [Chloroflexaceae bacterium]
MPDQPIDPWNVTTDDYPAQGDAAEQLRFMLTYAVLAPSGHNTQPWLFRFSNDSVEIYADRTRALPVVDPDDRELVMSCGTALFNLRLALRYFGYTDHVELRPDPDNPDLLARIRRSPGSSATDNEQALFAAIPTRRTNRQPFAERAVAAAVLADLQQAAATEGAWLQIVSDNDTRNALADLIAEGDRIQGNEP